LIRDTTTKDKKKFLFMSTDQTVPLVRITTNQGAKLENKRIVVSIDSWSRTSKYPDGHFVRLLGNAGDKDVEAEALLVSHHVRYQEWSPQVRECVPERLEVTEADMEFRTDLRHLNIVSIDPIGCTDIDDALHAYKLPNGNFNVGVHIADVTYYVKEDTPLDKEAAKRGVSVYLADRRIDMLPSALSTNICSLREKVDRVAFSVMWEITPEAEIKSTEFCRTVICSRRAFTYGEAQQRIDDKSLDDDITQSLRALNSIAKQLRSMRLEKGALTLASPQVKFIKDEETNDPIDVELYQTKETNSLVEEFMLLANISVAKQIHGFFPAKALLRRHPSPDPKKLEGLIQIVKKLGVTLDVGNSKELSDSLDKANVSSDPFVNKLIRILATRCMQQARYFASGSVPPSEFHHYGLAAPIYTHFTSPIRRYADIIVHRLLAASIAIAPVHSSINRTGIQRTCDRINRSHRMAEYASRDSVKLHTIYFFKGKVIEEDAYVMSVRSNGFHVMVARYGIEEVVYIPKGIAKFDERAQELDFGSFKLSIFAKVKIRLEVDESVPHSPKIVLTCLDPNFSNAKPKKSTPSDKRKRRRNSRNQSKKQKIK